jgi:molybdate transport system substrate-binding protein
VVAAPPPVLDSLANSGKIAAESKTGLVRSANGVAIRTGAPKPDVSSLENFKRALLDAKSITYLPVPGVPQLIERLGLKEALAAKTTIPKTDLSSEIQFYTAFGGAISANSKSRDAAVELLKFLKGSSALRVIKEQGMEPI